MITLHTGTSQLQYENGFLRQLRLGDAEVLRMIYFAVRDQNWNTIPVIIIKEDVINHKDSFIITYEARCQQNEVDFSWNCKIEGKEDGSITFEIHGKALSDFLRNRIGFCVLHPIQECAGQLVWITHSDASETQEIFPKLISAHQPFKDIQAMRWNVTSVTACIQFFGEIFETEDQRNWLDASYKTYCTPLDLPFPVEIKRGDELHQKIEFKIIQNAENEIIENQANKYFLTATKESYRIPPIGLEANEEELDAVSIARLQDLNLSLLRVEMRLHEVNWEEGFTKRLQQARALELPIQLVLFLNKNWEIEHSTLQTYPFQIQIRSIILIDVNNKTLTFDFLNKVLPILKQAFKNIPIGGGTNAYFTEFNRFLPPTENLDFVSFSVNPQVHAFDEHSLIENLETASYIIESATHLATLPVSVSPITLRPRFNPDEAAPEKMETGRMPFRVDTRQRTVFGAVWTLGSILAFAKTAVKDLTYYQTIGEEGLLMPNRVSKYVDFEAVSQEVFPMYEVFKLLGQFKGGRMEPLRSGQPLVFEGFLIKNALKENLILINYTSENISVQAFEKNYLLSPYQTLIE